MKACCTPWPASSDSIAVDAAIGPVGITAHAVGADAQAEALAERAGERSADLLGGAALGVARSRVAVGGTAVPVITDAFGDDVDHAGDGVGAVDRRGAVGQHFNALDHRGRDGSQVGVAAGADAHALAVQQHQGALRAQAAQVDVLAAHFFARGQGVGTADGRRTGRRQVLHDIADAGEALLLDVGALPRAHGLRGFHARLADARAGDRNAVQVGRGLRFLGGSKGRRQRQRDAGGQQAEPHCGITNVHLSLQGTC
ncbi:hypothetical protein G6F24_014148 [Rhizopus arrhizus]|nr:hypothetical protein G6F24_014148 [Rhizopus arrhizus]